MNVQEFDVQGRKDVIGIAISNETLEGDSNDNHSAAEASLIQVVSQEEAMKVGASDFVVGSGDDVSDKSQKDCSELIDNSGGVKESQPCNLQADPRESFEVGVNFEDKQHVEPSNGLGENAVCASQPTEIQKTSLEDKSVAGLDSLPESEILATISDESRSQKGDNGVENVFQDNEKKILSEPKDTQDAIEVEPGICRTKDSGEVNDCGSILEGTENNSSVLFVNVDSISEGKECYQHVDDSEKPFELRPSISIVKPETEHAEEETLKLLSEPDKNQDAISVVCENGPFEVAHGFVSEEPGTQIVNEPSVEIQESYQHVDNSEKPLDLHLSSGISEAQIPAFMVPKPETDLGGENISEDMRMKLLPESDENDVAIADIYDNGHLEGAHGLSAEGPGAESVSGPSFNKNEDHPPILFVKHIVLGRNEPNQRIDDSETPFETPSSSISSTPVVASNCLKLDTDLGEKNISEDMRMELLPESDENDAAIAEIYENGHFQDAHGLSAEEPGAKCVKGPSFIKNEDHPHVLFVKHIVLGRNESNQRNDDSETPFETPSSSIYSTPVVAFNCLKLDTDLGEGPDQCNEDAPDIDVFQGHEVDQEVSSCNEVVEVKLVEDLKTVAEDVDAFAVESVETEHYISKDPKSEIESSVPDTPIMVTEQAAQIEYSADQAAQIEYSANQAAQIEYSADQAAQTEESVDQADQTENLADQAALTEDSAALTEDQAALTEDSAALTEDQAALTEDSAAQAAQTKDSAHQAAQTEDSADQDEGEMTTSHGDDLNFKNEIVIDNAESNNVSPLIPNAAADLKQEKSSSTSSRNMSSSDGSERPFEVHSSSSSSIAPIVVSGSMKPEIDLGERPCQKIENVPDIDVFQGHEVDQDASSFKEIAEGLRPDNDDIDTLAIGSVENGHYITKDKDLEIKSCIPDITVTDQAAEIEDSAGRDTNLSSPGEVAGLEKKTTTSVKVDDFSSSDGNEPALAITEPVYGITEPDREMATFKGEGLNSKNEIVLANAGSNDITVVSSTEPDFKQENSSSIGSRNMSPKDDSGKSFEMTSNLNAPFVVSSIMKPEIELGERLGRSIENASVNHEDSSYEGSVNVVFLEGVRPENEVTDALGVEKGVESVENGHYIAGVEKHKIKPFVPDTLTVTDNVAENENAAVGEADFSSPGNIARLENNANPSIKADGFSGSDGHSSVEYINGTKSDLDTTNSERETITFNGAGLDSKNEISLVNDKSNDIPAVVSNVKSDFAQESASEGDFSGGPFSIETLPDLHVGNGDFENKEEQISDTSEKLIVQEGHDVEKSVGSPEPLQRPFTFLVRMPKFDDTKLREQVRQGQILVEDKTRLRDAFRVEISKYRNNCRDHGSKYKAAMDEARVSKRAVKSKRAEIDSLHTVIDKAKNAQSVKDIDARIVNLEYKIEHETMPLSKEKDLIREIKQLKQHREQLASNIGCLDEVQQAMNDRDQIEARLKGLKKELDGLKDSVLKAEAIARDVDKIYEGENKKLKEAQDQYTAADNVRQEAYIHMQNLKTEMYEKNQRFRLYKRDASAAYDHAAKRDTEALHNLCFNQVENVMEVWKNDAEFRKEYVTSNMRSTLRRLGTLDGRSLGPDEKPHLVSNHVVLGGGVEKPVNPFYEPVTESQEKHIVEGIALSNNDSKKVKEEEEKEAPLKKSLEAKKMTNQEKVRSETGVEKADVSGSSIIIIEVRAEEERLPNKEELELARKAEERRKEQLRLEEKAKALEALERKKKIAEKAQLRAELRAQKEAEQKEKEREKRLRKKERKKATGSEATHDTGNSGDTIAKTERVVEPTKEPEIKELSSSATTIGKRTQKAVQYIKQSKNKSSIPPPLRNKGKKKLHQWVWGIVVTILVVIIVFSAINLGFFSNLWFNLKPPSSV